MIVFRDTGDPRRDIESFIDDLCDDSMKQSRLIKARQDYNRAMTRKCGGCVHWMKSNSCPRERNVNGWNRGPSMNDSPCSQFEWKQWYLNLQKERRAELDEAVRAAKGE